MNKNNTIAKIIFVLFAPVILGVSYLYARANRKDELKSLLIASIIVFGANLLTIYLNVTK